MKMRLFKDAPKKADVVTHDMPSHSALSLQSIEFNF
jgi:hypothetical protein